MSAAEIEQCHSHIKPLKPERVLGGGKIVQAKKLLTDEEIRT
jgi:hypothetical protein